MKLSDFPRRVFIQKEALAYPLTERILEKVKAQVSLVSGADEIREEIASVRDPIGEGKKIIYLTVQRGRFLKPCPCSPGVVSCGYLVVNSILGCPLDCSYCILQSYLTDPWITVLVNESDLMASLKPILVSTKAQGWRVGTGELSDSLALEWLTGQGERLATLFKQSLATSFKPSLPTRLR